MPRRSHLKSGLARAELLFVFALLLILGSLIFPLWVEWRNYRGSIRAYSELRLIISAADLYNREYRLWPAPDATGRTDVRYGWANGNSAIIRILRGQEGEGNESHRANLQQIDFIEIATREGRWLAPRLDGDGNWIDPWGRNYQIVFDANYDNICSIPESSYSDVVGEGVVMWSMGPDRAPDNDDDLRTWMTQ